MAEKLSEGREKKNISNKLTKTTTPERQEKKKIQSILPIL